MKRKIAIITSDLEYFNASICMGLYKEFFKRNFDTQIYLTYENPDREKELIESIIKDKSVAGLIIFSCLNNSTFYQGIIKQIYIPCVFLDRLLPYLSQCNFVTSDNYGGAKKIGELLIQKGSKSIACLSMLKEISISTIEDRVNGFRDSHNDNTIVNCFREELAYNDTFTSMKMVLQKWEENNSFPDAIFATNHLIINAFITLTQQNDKWKKLSQNTILSCFDNLPYFDWLEKPIISAEQPIQEYVNYTTAILLRRIENPKLLDKYANIILPVKIIDRTIKN